MPTVRLLRRSVLLHGAAYDQHNVNPALSTLSVCLEERWGNSVQICSGGMLRSECTDVSCLGHNSAIYCKHSNGWNSRKFLVMSFQIKINFISLAIKKTGARSARAHSKGKNKTSLINICLIICYIGSPFPTRWED